jgi:hypothetical protein
MYFLIVAALLFFFPLASILAQTLVDAHGMPNAIMAAKWFAFWAVGVRLMLAGVRQVIQPRYTAEVILGLKSNDSLFVVRELGFANIALSIVGLGSLLAPAWVVPASIAGAIFYSFAAINHFNHGARNSHQNFAMITDLAVAAVLAACVAAR